MTFSFSLPKSGFLWIMWLAVGGDTATDLILIGSCSFVGACSNSINIFQPVLIRLLKKNKALGSQAACNESSGIAALAFLSWIACKSLVSTLQRKTPKFAVLKIFFFFLGT